jgi:hypothetical protein
MEITREDAVKLIQNELAKMTKQQLEETLFTLYADNKLYNFNLVEDYNGDWDIKFIDRQDEFNDPK